MDTRYSILFSIFLPAVLLFSSCQDAEDIINVAPDDTVHEETSQWTLQLTGVDSARATLEINDRISSSACNAELLLRFETHHVRFATQSMDCRTRGGRFSGRDSSTYPSVHQFQSLTVIDTSTLLVHSPPTLFRSTDGGHRWRDISPRPAAQAVSIWANDGSKYGMLYLKSNEDDDRGLYRSSDLGNSWERIPGRDGDFRFPLLIAHPSSGVLYTLESAAGKTQFLRSSDRGEHWDVAFSFGDDRFVQYVAFDDAGRCYATTGWTGIMQPPLVAVSDDGLHWNVRVIDKLSPVGGNGPLHAGGDGIVLISGRDGRTVESTDQGRTWRLANCKPYVIYACPALIIPGTRWLLATTGKLYGKSVGEDTWTPVEPGLTSIKALQRDRFGTVWATGTGHISRSSDQGSSFKPFLAEPAWCTLAFTRTGDTLTGTYIEQPVKSGPVTTWTVKGLRVR